MTFRELTENTIKPTFRAVHRKYFQPHCFEVEVDSNDEYCRLYVAKSHESKEYDIWWFQVVFLTDSDDGEAATMYTRIHLKGEQLFSHEQGARYKPMSELTPKSIENIIQDIIQRIHNQ